MDQQQGRIIRLEARVEHERERTDFHMASLSRRVDNLEVRPQGFEINTRGHGFKLLLAVGLTVLGFLITGDPKSALLAARFGLGMP